MLTITGWGLHLTYSSLALGFGFRVQYNDYSWFLGNMMLDTLGPYVEGLRSKTMRALGASYKAPSGVAKLV